MSLPRGAAGRVRRTGRQCEAAVEELPVSGPPTLAFVALSAYDESANPAMPVLEAPAI